MKKDKFSRLVLGFVKITGVPGTLIYFRPKVYYESERARREGVKGACIVMSNHTSLLDFPLYLTVFFGRSIRFLMAEVLFNKGKFFSWFLYKIGGIRVDRDTLDFSFIGESLEILDKGGAVGIFPESRLPVNGKPFPFKPSVVYMALRTDAPIVPVYTDGHYGFGKRAHVVVGERINIRDFCISETPSEEETARLTRILQDKVYSLAKTAENNGR